MTLSSTGREGRGGKGSGGEGRRDRFTDVCPDLDGHKEDGGRSLPGELFLQVCPLSSRLTTTVSAQTQKLTVSTSSSLRTLVLASKASKTPLETGGPSLSVS